MDANDTLEESCLSPQTDKRKRSNSNSPTRSEHSSKISKTDNVEPVPSTSKPLCKKRKFIYPTPGLRLKNSRKFFFIDDSMTKQRKPRPAMVTQEDTNTDITRKHKMHCGRVDSGGNLYLMHRSHASDILLNDEKTFSYEKFKSVDLSYHIVDEIALEGLDGITLEAFWKRLKDVFPVHINKSMTDRIWRFICNNKRINFYILKEPRENLVFFNRYKSSISMQFTEPLMDFKDIYPFQPVNDKEVKGSCSTFETRKENNGVRKFSLGKANKLYDQRLVLVADQTLRNKALINNESDPTTELIDFEYCVLERIGRTRKHGEMSATRSADVKKTYHIRKNLSNLHLIVPQQLGIKSNSQNVNCALLQLSRFYSKRKSKVVALMERATQILRTKPNYQMDFVEFRQIIGWDRTLVKAVKSTEFRKFFKLSLCPYRKLYPNATRNEYTHKSNKFKERLVKVLKLLDPYANVTTSMDFKETKELPYDPSECNPGQKHINIEYLYDLYLYILSSGIKGVSIHDMLIHFKIDFYSVRTAMRKLLLKNVVSSHKVDSGRQQTLRFYAKCFDLNEYQIKTEPTDYKLNQETLNRILKPYETLPESTEFNSVPDPEPENTEQQTVFKINFDPFFCSVFLTEQIDTSCEELTICDIVIKGRDKLLLISSNLFAQYINEWEGFLLKREPFIKGIQLLQNGFGKVIYDFLTTIRVNFESDKSIIFKLEDIKLGAKIVPQNQTQRVLTLNKNYCNPHSDANYSDTISKIYLFEAMFNKLHQKNQTQKKLKSIFERLMILDGKKKVTEEQSFKSEADTNETIENTIIMEKYMGSTPELKYRSEEDDVVIEIFVSTPPEKVIDSLVLVDETDLTQRYINRANLILKNVYEQKVVKEASTLFKDIIKEEDEEGYDKKVCKKSVNSILARLITDGYIKCYKVVMSGKNRIKSQCFICVHDVDYDDCLIRAGIEQFKLKFYVGVENTKKVPAPRKKPNESPFSNFTVKESITELKQLISSQTHDLVIDRTRGREYGYAPKFVRMRLLHELLFYIIREFTKGETLTSRQVFELCKNSKIKVSQEDVETMPEIYRNEVGWKMFIPPLPQQLNWSKGWALVCDIILRIPLVIFLQLYYVSYNIPGLEDYLKHPFKKYFLLKHLPPEIRNVLLYKRKFFHTIYDSICNLCYAGLVQLGARNFKEKDQLFIFLNSRGALYDTTTSSPNYHHVENKDYKKTVIEFKTPNDVDIYWSELLRICMNTRLGKRKICDGQLITIEDCASKPAMMAALIPKNFNEVQNYDLGGIPGDHRGAAGLDSSMWSFLKRNWSWKAKVIERKKESKVETIKYPTVRYDQLVKDKIKVRKPIMKRNNVVKTFSKKKYIRKIIFRKRKKVREYSDAIDRSIMRKNPGLKVEWNENEDQFLRYLRIVSVFLCPIFKKQFIPYNILRDVLHRISPEDSKNKTARAIQRRIYVLLTQDEIIKIMESNVENLLNSDNISRYFAQIHERYKSGLKITDSQLQILFVYFMSYVAKHRKEVELLLMGCFASFDFFSQQNINETETNLLNFAEKNHLIYTNPKCREDITIDTIKSTVHCSISCRQNSKSWTYYLTRIYKRYPESLILSTVVSLRKDQFFVRNRQEDKSQDNVWAPIRFSQIYKMMKGVSYTTDMYREAYKNFLATLNGTPCIGFMDFNEIHTFWDRINLTFEIPEMGIILDPSIQDHDEVVEEIAKRFHLYLKELFAKNPCKNERTTNISDDVNNRNLDSVKEEVRLLVFRVPYLLDGDIEVSFRKMLDSDNLMEIKNCIFLMIVELKKFAQSTNTLTGLKKLIDEIKDEISDLDELLKDLSKVVFAIQNILQHQSDESFDSEKFFDDLFQLWEADIGREQKKEVNKTRRGILYKNYSSGMENCIKRAQNGDVPSIEEIKVGIIAESEENRLYPHITDLLMLLDENRFPDLDINNEKFEDMKNHFVMQYPQLDQFVIEDLEEMKENEAVRTIMDQSKLVKVEKRTENVVKSPTTTFIEEFITEKQGTSDDIRIAYDLIKFIKDGKELGVFGFEIKEKFASKFNFELIELINCLIENFIILRAGIVSITFVHHDYQKEWLTESFTLTPNELQVFETNDKEQIQSLKSFIGEKIPSSNNRHVQLKPWSRLDGTTNRDLFIEWLCIILSKCIDLPNIPVLAICEQFHYIKPVDIFYMLEILQEIGSVKIYSLENVNCDLYEVRYVIKEGEATCLDSFESMFVKPTNTGGLSFGYFLDMSLL